MDRPLTRFLLVRHAHVDIGPAPGRLCGWFDAPLSGRGRAQLARLREHPLVAPAPDALYTSPLTRASEVAAALADIWNLREQVVPDLREIHCGQLDGMPIADIQRDYPDVWARQHAQADDELAWPGGESYREFRRRVLGALSELAGRHSGGRVVVVTHAGVISQVLGRLKGRPPAVWEVDRPDPLTLTEVTWADGAPMSLIRFGARASR